MSARWNDALAAPPREVYSLLELARDHGLWLRWARSEYHKRLDGGRYRLTRGASLTPLLTTDSLDTVKAYLHAMDVAT